MGVIDGGVAVGDLDVAPAFERREGRLYVDSGRSTRRGQILRASLSLLGDKSLAAMLAVDVTLQVMRLDLHTASSRNKGS